MLKQFVNLSHGWLSFQQTDVLRLTYTSPLSWKCRVFSMFVAAKDAVRSFVHKTFSVSELPLGICP